MEKIIPPNCEEYGDDIDRIDHNDLLLEYPYIEIGKYELEHKKRYKKREGCKKHILESDFFKSQKTSHLEIPSDDIKKECCSMEEYMNDESAPEHFTVDIFWGMMLYVRDDEIRSSIEISKCNGGNKESSDGLIPHWHLQFLSVEEKREKQTIDGRNPWPESETWNHQKIISHEESTKIEIVYKKPKPAEKCKEEKEDAAQIFLLSQYHSSS